MSKCWRSCTGVVCDSSHILERPGHRTPGIKGPTAPPGERRLEMGGDAGDREPTTLGPLLRVGLKMRSSTAGWNYGFVYRICRSRRSGPRRSLCQVNMGCSDGLSGSGVALCAADGPVRGFTQALSSLPPVNAQLALVWDAAARGGILLLWYSLRAFH